MICLFDSTLSDIAIKLNHAIGGDLRRELTVLGQFGAIGSLLLVSLIVWTLDRQRCRHLLDLLAASLSSAAAVFTAKLIIGRPRPKLEEPALFVGPWRPHPIGEHETPTYAWQFWRDNASELWSIPSGHTAAAAALAVWLALTYPRLRWVMVACVAVVGLSRITNGAHYPSDVVLGGAIGFFVAHSVVSGWLGTRSMDVLWRCLVNPEAQPAFPIAYRTHNDSMQKIDSHPTA